MDSRKHVLYTLGEALQHLRQMHFALVLICSTLFYVAYGTTITTPLLTNELGTLRIILDTLKHKEAHPDAVINLVDREWRDQRLDNFRKYVFLALQPAKSTLKFDDIVRLVTLIPTQAPFTWSEEESLDVLKQKLKGTLLIRIPTKVTRLTYRPVRGAPLNESAPFSEQKISKRVKSFVVFVANVDTDKKQMLFKVEWWPHPPPGEITPFQSFPVGTIELTYADQIVDANLGINFEERFPELQRIWKKVKTRTIEETTQYSKDKDRETMRGVQTNIFGIEVEGEGIALAGALGVNLILLYLSSCLGQLRLYLDVAADEISQKTYFLPAWVGVQNNIAAKIILWSSLVASPLSVITIYFRFHLTNIFVFILALIASSLAGYTYYLTVVVWRKLPI